MKLKFKNYSIEDFASEKSFINYCLNNNDDDVSFWNEWILNNPDRTKDVNQAKSIVVKYSLGLSEPELSFERNEFIAKLDAISNEPVAKKTVVISPVWSYVGRVAAVLVIALGLGVIIKMTFGDQKYEVLATASKTIKRNPVGQKSIIYLSDGTKVILNAESSMEFDEDFGNVSREVTLVGEAFFEVAKDVSKPFVIKTGEVTTTVLGTSFNVNAYPEMNGVQVAVMTGKVAVENTSATDSSVSLKPTEMVTYDARTGILTPSVFLPEEIISWKDGIIYFKNADEKSVFAKLEKWYGVKVEAENESPRSWNITAEYDNLSLGNVLKSLSYAANFEYVIDKKKVILKY
ncbi:FecR domain-containing protein [Reichenbachiella sp. MALMAid0571]|uniref:FecR family protein n=1 Tax=Reichenbachiella sp. MALMAid0571 TaxID=3143939 RepID=UPI0032DFA68F